MKTLERLRDDRILATEINKLEARLWRIVRRDKVKVIMVTSAVRGEGKSTTTAYLATALGLYPERKVLAIDFDFRIPTLNRHFGLEVPRGVEEVLAGKASVKDVIIDTGLPSLHVALPRPGEADPELLLRSRQVSGALTALREMYDLILLDVPAIIPVPDATVLMPYTDGVVLAGMAGKTSEPQLNRALDLCRGLDANIVGLVIGNVHEAAPDYLADDYNYYGYGDAEPRRRSKGE